MSWLRWWQGTVNDPKWRIIAARAKCRPADCVAVWAYLLELAKDGEGDVSKLDAEECAVVLGHEPETIEGIVEAMTARGLLDRGDDGLAVAAWEKRQPKREDDSRQRVAEFRRRKAAERSSVSAVSDTAAKRDVTHGNADVTRGNAPESESESESEKKETTATSAGARPPDVNLHALASRLFEAGGDALNRTAASLEPMTIPLGWIRDGADLDLDILPTIARVAARQPDGKVRKWSYFTEAISEAKADRERGLPDVSGRKANGGSKYERIGSTIANTFDGIRADIARSRSEAGNDRPEPAGDAARSSG